MNPLKTMPRTYSLSLSLATLLILAASPCRGQQPQTPSALEKAVTISYFPSLRKLAVRVADAAAVGTAKEAGVEVRRTDDARPVARGKLPLSAKGGQVVLDLPALADGAYEVHLSLLGGGPTVVKRFKQRNYPWLGNKLGKNNAVYPPFQPVKVRGHTAEVVLRTYILNGFGLWCSVKSQGKEILAAPIRLRIETGAGEQGWQFASGHWTASEPRRAVYEGAAAAPAVEVRTTSSLEYDGCMKVEIDMLPGKQPEPIHRMWLEIPLRDGEFPLFHYCAMDGMRRNYAGKTPRGGEIIWGPQAAQGWLPPLWKAEPAAATMVCSGRATTYAPIRRMSFPPTSCPTSGWAAVSTDWRSSAPTTKGISSIPGTGCRPSNAARGVLYLRVDLINQPSSITSAKKVFGLQASPTRPMPEGWRGDPTRRRLTVVQSSAGRIPLCRQVPRRTQLRHCRRDPAGP